MTTAELVDRYAAAVVALRIAENRLAKVPALVEALRRVERWADEAEEGWHVGGIASEALAEWERE